MDSRVPPADTARDAIRRTKQIRRAHHGRGRRSATREALVSRFFEAEAFVIVVDEGSFTGAAKRLGVTKSYASKLVSRLEDRLGVRLLHRSTRTLSLTEPGRTYFERCTEVM